LISITSSNREDPINIHLIAVFALVPTVLN
jgi:hypothetical protein